MKKFLSKIFNPKVRGTTCMLISILSYLTGAVYFKWGCDIFKEN